MLTDVEYAIRQLKFAQEHRATFAANDATQRALDALERVHGQLLGDTQELRTEDLPPQEVEYK